MRLHSIVDTRYNEVDIGLVVKTNDADVTYATQFASWTVSAERWCVYGEKRCDVINESLVVLASCVGPREYLVGMHMNVQWAGSPENILHQARERASAVRFTKMIGYEIMLLDAKFVNDYACDTLAIAVYHLHCSWFLHHQNSYPIPDKQNYHASLILWPRWLQ